jgi:hypothetical protein
VAEDREFQSELQKIGTLVRELENIADPASQSAARELVQLLMRMHGRGLERILELLHESDDPGSRLIEELAKDPIVSGLLVLYDLHPDDIQVRVVRKLDQLGPTLFRMGAEARIVSIDQGVVRLRVEANSRGCGSTFRQIQTALEDAIYEAAPDLSRLVIDGLEQQAGGSGFVSVEKLTAPAPTVTA